MQFNGWNSLPKSMESFYERGAKFNQEWPEIYARLKDFMVWIRCFGKRIRARTNSRGRTVTKSPKRPVIEEPKPEPEKEAKPRKAIQESDLLSVKVNAGGLGNVTEYHPNGKRAFSWEVRNFLNEGRGDDECPR